MLSRFIIFTFVLSFVILTCIYADNFKMESDFCVQYFMKIARKHFYDVINNANLMFIKIYKYAQYRYFETTFMVFTGGFISSPKCLFGQFSGNILQQKIGLLLFRYQNFTTLPGFAQIFVFIEDEHVFFLFSRFFVIVIISPDRVNTNRSKNKIFNVLL